MMNVDLLLNQDIKYIIPLWKKVSNYKEAACFLIPPPPVPFPG